MRWSHWLVYSKITWNQHASIHEIFSNFKEKAGYTGKIKIGMDVAASEFHKDGKYDLDFKNPESKPEDWISSEQLCEMYKGFVQKYPVVSIL